MHSFGRGPCQRWGRTGGGCSGASVSLKCRTIEETGRRARWSNDWGGALGEVKRGTRPLMLSVRHLTYGVRRPATCDALLVGPLPPPMNGMTVMTAYALGVSEIPGIRVRHFNISDHRHVENVGRLDLKNVLLALSHAVRLFRATREAGPKVVVLQIAQSTLGFLRDAALFLAIWCGGARALVYLHGAAFDE